MALLVGKCMMRCRADRPDRLHSELLKRSGMAACMRYGTVLCGLALCWSWVHAKACPWYQAQHSGSSCQQHGPGQIRSSPKRHLDSDRLAFPLGQCPITGIVMGSVSHLFILICASARFHDIALITSVQMLRRWQADASRLLPFKQT